MIDTSNINFHDAQILRVIEETQSDTVIMEVDYPVNYSESRYEKRRIVFKDAFNYQVHEQPFVGSPSILSISIIEEENEWGWIGFRLETNAGFREIYCKDIQLA